MRSPIGWILAASLASGAGCVVAEPPYYWEDPPGVVEVEPGIWVVPNWRTQVFYSDGWYWTYYEGRWYRGSGRHSGWRVVEVHQVPQRVVTVPAGRYVQWHPPPPAAHPVGPATVHPVAPPAHTVTPAVREEHGGEHEHP